MKWQQTYIEQFVFDSETCIGQYGCSRSVAYGLSTYYENSFIHVSACVCQKEDPNQHFTWFSSHHCHLNEHDSALQKPHAIKRLPISAPAKEKQIKRENMMCSAYAVMA